MIHVLAMLSVQSLLGAFDNLWHHEITEALPSRPGARLELALHTAREFLYAVIFTGIAWFRWQGGWGIALLAILATEIVITLWDFVVEDRTRKLPRFERILHTVLAINFGATLAVWAPELQAWVTAPTALAPAYYGMWSWVMTLFGMGVFAWAIRDLAAVVSLGVPAWQRRPIRVAPATGLSRTVLVTGGTGFIGWALVRKLAGRGDRVIVLTRDPAKARDQFGPGIEICGALRDLDRSRPIDAIVNLAGEPLAGGLWTKSRKRRFLESRLGVTRDLIALIEKLDHKPEVLINASAIGYYGDRGDEELTEASAPQPVFMSDLCRSWEEAALAAERFGVRISRLRIGLVLGRDGGVAQPMALTTRLGLGAIMGDGKQFVSWIHLDDLIELILFAVERTDMAGPINAVAPHPVSHESFMRGLGEAFGRSVRLSMPANLLRVAIGEMADLMLTSQRVVPAAALEAGFPFRYPELSGALADLFGSEAASQANGGEVCVYMNDACPVCEAEMAHYEGQAVREDLPITFERVGCAKEGLPEFGLSAADLRRRLYVMNSAGELRSGIDAFIALWSALPRYRWASRLVARPVVRPIAALIYDGVCVPILERWNARRAARAKVA
jgi:uncharacterized protein (TIGR01777 family)